MDDEQGAARGGLDEETVTTGGRHGAVDRTVVVQRVPQALEETVVVHRGDGEVHEETVVIARPAVEETVVVQRDEPAFPADTMMPAHDEIDHETVAVDRGRPPTDDATADSGRGEWLPEGTVRVQRAGSAPAFHGPLGDLGLGAAPSTASRFSPPAGGRRAVVGAGAGAVSRYTARRVQAPSPAPAPLVQAMDPTRDPQAVLPSVRRRARRGAIVALASAAGAVVVAVVGLVVVIPLLLAG